MTGSRKRKLSSVWIVIVALFLGLALWLLWESAGPSGQLTVELQPEYEWVEKSGSIRVAAIVTTKDGSADQGADYKFTWDSSGGIISGRGANITWKAPQKYGEFDVKVEVRRKDGQVAKASTKLTVKTFMSAKNKKKKDDAVEDPLTANEPQNTTGYEILSVKFDKEHLCDHDDVRVTIEAKDPRGGNEMLYPRVTFPGSRMFHGFDFFGSIGSQHKYNPELTKDPDNIKIELYDMRTGMVVLEKLVPFSMGGGCETEHGGLRVFCDESGYGQEFAKCETRILKKGFKAVRHEWSAGFDYDELQPVPKWTGNVAHIQVPVNIQDSYISTFKVRAKAFAADGSWIEGRATRTILNRYFEEKELLGVLRLLAIHHSEAYTDGTNKVLHVKLINPHSEAVFLNNLNERHFECPKEDQKAKKHNEINQGVLKYSGGVASKIGQAQFEPGETFEFDMIRPHDPKRCVIDVRAEGWGVESNIPASVRWIMMTRPKSQLRQMSSEYAAAASKAIKILSKRYGKKVHGVTPRQLEELANEGLIVLPGPTELPSEGAHIPPGQKEMIDKLRKKLEKEKKEKEKRKDSSNK
jgi:hypothetical protein